MKNNNDEFIDEQIEDYTDEHYQLAALLSENLNLSEQSAISIAICFNPKHSFYKMLYRFLDHLKKRKNKSKDNINENDTITEEYEFDYQIDQTTSTFLKEIENHFNEEKISLKSETIKQIDSFLYLINANYFNAIQSLNPNIKRETIIDQLLYVISSYMRYSNNLSFDSQVAVEVLNNCIFIPDNIKKDIIERLTNNNYRNNLHQNNIGAENTSCGDEESYFENKQVSTTNCPPGWDLNHKGNYIILIEALENSKRLENFDINSIKYMSWDIDFIQTVLIHIDTNYQQQLLLQDESYSSFNLAVNYLTSTMIYAITNNIENVTSEVLIASFKNWDYLPMPLKSQILSEIVKNQENDSKNHPSQKTTSKQLQKTIIPFQTNYNK